MRPIRPTPGGTRPGENPVRRYAMTARAQRRERAIAFFKEPESPTRVGDHVAEGGTLRSLSRVLDIKYVDLYNWIHDNTDVLESYTKALEARESNHRELVMDGLLDSSTVDLRKLYDAKGKLIPLNKLPDEIALAMQGVEVVEGEDGKVTTKYRMQDRTKNRELLGRVYGMFTDKVDHSGKLTMEQLIASSMEPSKPGDSNKQ